MTKVIFIIFNQWIWQYFETSDNWKKFTTFKKWHYNFNINNMH